jgi:hypothetical protein
MDRFENQPSGDERIGIVYEAFRKEADGSWTSVRNSDVTTSDGNIRIGAGMDFRRGVTIRGVDVAKRLDEELAARQSQPATADSASTGQSQTVEK